jgi:hypothetical protein
VKRGFTGSDNGKNGNLSPGNVSAFNVQWIEDFSIPGFVRPTSLFLSNLTVLFKRNLYKPTIVVITLTFSLVLTNNFETYMVGLNKKSCLAELDKFNMNNSGHLKTVYRLGMCG